MLGSFAQFGVTSHLYSLFLAVYFVLIVRFGMKERTFAMYERWIHVTILFFAITTAIAGILLGIFRPSILSPGCWISAPPEGCSEDCPEAKWAWGFGGLPSILTLVGISICNTMLYLHVRRTVMQGQMKAMANENALAAFQVKEEPSTSAVDPPKSSGEHKQVEDEECSDQQQLDNNSDETLDSDTDCSSVPITPSSSLSCTTAVPTTPSRKVNNNNGNHQRGSVLRSSDKQWKRVQEVGKQGFLYVGAYLLSFTWSLAINYLDSKDFEYKRGSENYLFPLLVMQALFVPALGFFNAVVFFRPKLIAARARYPNEPFWWVLRQVVGGAAGNTNHRALARHTSRSITTSGNHNNNHNKRTWMTRINFAGERLSFSRLSIDSSDFTTTSKWAKRIGGGSGGGGGFISKSSSLHVISEIQPGGDNNKNHDDENDNDEEVPGASNYNHYHHDDYSTEQDTSGSQNFELWEPQNIAAAAVAQTVEDSDNDNKSKQTKSNSQEEDSCI
mmetsp:Transcript_16910/g.41194  ORF Transcript_16910/g.41194 Transcript_16910/m.41194 type:complete len:502 (+) Transcript_16910:269-1774(+)